MVFVSTTALQGNYPDVFDVLDVYSKLGIKNIELGSKHSKALDLNKLKQYQIENEARFIVHGFFPPTKDAFMLNLGCKGLILNKTMNFIKKSLEFCNKFDIKIYSFHGAFTANIDGNEKLLGQSVSYESAYQEFTQNMAILADIAKDLNVKIAVENSGYNSQSGVLMTSKQINRFFKEVNHKNIGLLLDLGHVKYGSKILGFDPKQFIKETQKWAIELHCHENDGRFDQHLNVNKDTLKDVDREILKTAAITLEANRLPENEILEGIKILKRNLD